jgi:hypothetical protein
MSVSQLIDDALAAHQALLVKEAELQLALAGFRRGELEIEEVRTLAEQAKALRAVSEQLLARALESVTAGTPLRLVN